MHRRLPVALTLLALGGLAGCGGGGSTTLTIDGTAGGASSSTPGVAPSPKAFGLPPAVPTRAGGQAADAVSRRVITKWLGALSDGQIQRAARFFAMPSKVQNGTQVLTLRSPADRVIFNDAFPCGAKATRMRRAAHGFTIVDFVLTERVGGNCMGGAGGRARSAIRVADGHIAEWYRLDTAAGGGTSPSPSPSPAPSVPSTPGTATQIA
ncbi:hypothetical protein NBH00_09390 [Paraconexibacter antarcticus]|uniref:Nuclear transport factor 2 family protein n=1 Tax=Paraconexibacter antarcticus TaxID=2949664 RepID=A0ABY5E0P6_9ACTN|nr:hypothetical protein [Paraconexibacter antarcticus]UTI66405.1 hypothetical protein NBH00_09390 [Paraconexibacter antarcticus]